MVTLHKRRVEDDVPGIVMARFSNEVRISFFFMTVSRANRMASAFGRSTPCPNPAHQVWCSRWRTEGISTRDEVFSTIP